jgi:hypothetical protein
MALASAPFPALAAVTSITIGGNTYGNGSGGEDPASNNIDKTVPEGWEWDYSAKTLTLGSAYSGTNPIKITADSTDTITLELNGDVTIDIPSNIVEVGIAVFGGSLTVAGTGHTLTIASGGGGGVALFAEDRIAIESGTVKVTASGGATIRSGGNVLITGGTVTTGGGGCGILSANGDITISGGTVDATGGATLPFGYALQAGGYVTISGGTTTTHAGAAGDIYGTLIHTGGYLNGLDKDGNPPPVPPTPPTPGGGSGGCDAGFGAGALLAAAGILAAGKKRRGR